MDDENPDPRQMATLMRKMCEYSGERMDEPMEEVIRKLEEGMNPEELEDRMGDFMGDENDAGTEEKDGEESMQSRLRKLLGKTPKRDPQLYEFRDFIKK
jgi:DNA-directed RNA polymerase sigma subunit (sigma70/sigma32)